MRQLAINDQPIWSQLDAALNWLKGAKVIDSALERRIHAEAVAQSSAGWALIERDLSDRIRDAVNESFAAGDSREEWRERFGQIIDVAAHEAETMGRTLTHRAYHEGLEQVTTEIPEVGELFPYRHYLATDDTRVRPTHAALDDKVALVGSPLHQEMEKRLAEYNCRCSMVPMTRGDAVAHGIDDNTGWTEPEQEEPEAIPQRIAAREIKPPKPPTLAELKAEQARIRAASTLDDKLQLFETGKKLQRFFAERHAPVLQAQAKAQAEEDEARKRAATMLQLEQKVKMAIRESTRAKYQARLEEAQRSHAEAVTKTLKAIEEAQREREAARKAADEALAAPPQQRLNLRLDVQIPGKSGDSARAGYEWLAEKMAEPNDTIRRRPQTLRFLPKATKRSYYGFNGTSYLGDDASPSTAAHELGHWINESPPVETATREFLKKRLPTPHKTRMIDVAPGGSYDLSEISNGDDDFARTIREVLGVSPTRARELAFYVGKVYSNQSEVISIGLELMMADAAKFAQADPEWFQLTLAAMKGVL